MWIIEIVSIEQICKKKNTYGREPHTSVESNWGSCLQNNWNTGGQGLSSNNLIMPMTISFDTVGETSWAILNHLSKFPKFFGAAICFWLFLKDVVQ